MTGRKGTPILDEITWQEAADLLRRRPVGLLPIGAIEAHGPHLPLETDVIIADATARRSAARILDAGLPAVVLPVIVYGISFVGMSFPGTSPADPDAFEAYLTSVLRHLAPQGYRAILCCNAHLEPGHVERIQQAAKTIEQDVGIPVRAPDQRSDRFAALLSDEFRAGARHAGSYETSIVLAAKPGAVREDVLRSLPPVWIDLPAKLREGSRTFLEAGSELGYFGDPAAASAEEGHRLLDALADMMMIACHEADIDLRS